MTAFGSVSRWNRRFYEIAYLGLERSRNQTDEQATAGRFNGLAPRDGARDPCPGARAASLLADGIAGIWQPALR